MKKQWILVAATIISSTLLTRQALAQQPVEQKAGNSQDSIRFKTLDEAIFTANKRPQKQSTTGKVLTVINRQTLENNSGRSLTQVLNEQSGLQVGGAQSAPGTNQTVYMRGAGSSNTLILIDGMPVTDGSGITIEFDLNHIAIDQVERVEILKGAQSTLYGSDAVAGVINIITRKNLTGKKIGLNAGIATGSYGTFKGNIGLSGKLGKQGQLDYSAQYNRYQLDGFSSAYDPHGNQNFDRDGLKQDLFNAALGYKVSSRWAIRGYWQQSNYKADIDDAAMADDRNNIIYNKQGILGLQSVVSLQKITITSNLSFNKVTRLYDDPVNDPVGPNDYDPYSADYTGHSLFAETYLNATLHQHMNLLAGVDYRKNTADIHTSYGELGSDSLKADMFSVYATLSTRNFERFGIEAGGRFTEHNDFGTSFTYSVNPYYFLHRQLKVFASYATAFKAPSLYNLASEYGNKELDPEKSSQLEIGLQATNKAANLSARATFFNRKINDLIIFQSSFTPPYGQYMNADEQKDHGAELELRWDPTEKWRLTANYSFLEGAITTEQNGKDSSYFNLYRRPKHNLNLYSGYQLTPKFYVGVGIRWVDKREDLFFNPDRFETEKKTLDSYYNLDLNLKYQVWKSMDIYLDLRNITDQQYFELYGYNTRRFNMMVGIRFSL